MDVEEEVLEVLNKIWRGEGRVLCRCALARTQARR